jgi:hypothetical protein
MKTLGLSFILSICLASLGHAQAAGDQNSHTTKPSAEKPGLVTDPVAGGAADRLILNLNSDQPDSANSSCASMRTYRVKRRGRGSETVGPAGYTTCVPMRRFEMRSAVEPR